MNKKGGDMAKCKKSSVKKKSNLKDVMDKVWPKTKKEVEEIVHKVWPKTKKELESALKNTKTMLTKGEAYIKDVSEKGVKNTKKMSLSLKKEKLYYTFGKLAINTPKANWDTNKRMETIIAEVKKLDREIKKIK
jgi:hypothetical protein